ncbi:MAG TPA: heme A synthase [Gammaproteobacteria bacterium]|nr:heme A synthase [Gammaproteobacteria bacterium]
MTSALTRNRLTAATPPNRAVAVWLLICCTAIFAMVVLGGVTRLTGSGLSMVTWDPLTGVLPPLNQGAWEEAFHRYQQFPEFQYKNAGMDLKGFKTIFWLEYAHRLLGRSIGLIFFIPLFYFSVTGRLAGHLQRQVLAIFALGAVQGLVGWYMVQSGLVDNPHVSQYRLAAHLGLAFIIYSSVLWLALNLFFPPSKHRSPGASPALKRLSLATAGAVFFTALSGAFVAGLKAGFIYNTFPMMGDRWLPEELLALSPAWRNVFENAVTVQFDHRLLALTVAAVVLALWKRAYKERVNARARLAANLLLTAVALQLALGITTLLLEVPVALGAAHQAGALVLLTAAVFAVHAVRDDDGMLSG